MVQQAQHGAAGLAMRSTGRLYNKAAWRPKQSTRACHLGSAKRSQAPSPADVGNLIRKEKRAGKRGERRRPFTFGGKKGKRGGEEAGPPRGAYKGERRERK